MESWIDVYDFIAGKLREAERIADYYRGEADKLRAENEDLKRQMEGASDGTEDTLEAAR